ncbi:hypothetical protein ACFL3K_01770 [Pseudomonadota bacterium]
MNVTINLMTFDLAVIDPDNTLYAAEPGFFTRMDKRIYDSRFNGLMGRP